MSETIRAAQAPAARAAILARAADRKLSLRALSRASGVPNSLLSEFTTGKQDRIAYATLEKLAPALDCTVAELTGEAPSTGLGPAGAAQGEVAGIQAIAFDRIRASALNPRKTFDDVQLAELAVSIEQRGLLQNLVVRPAGEHFELKAGERRWRAIGMLVADGRRPADWLIPCLVQPDDGDAELLLDAIVENAQRKDVPPLEGGEAFVAYLATAPGATTATIAEKTGKTQRYVQQRIALARKLTEEGKALLAAGRITIEEARALTAASPEKQKALAKELAAPYRRGALRSAAAIEEEAKRDWVPAKHAAFPRDKWKGEVATDEDGEEHLVGRTAFMRLQRAHAKARVAELEKEWAWARVSTGWWYDSYGRSKDKAKAGVVVHIGPDGALAEKTALLENPRQSGGGYDPAAHKALQERQARRRELIEAANERIRAALRAAPPALSLRIATHDLLAGDYKRFAAAPLQPWLGDLAEADKKGQAKPFADKRAAALWKRLGGLTLEQLAGLFAVAHAADARLLSWSAPDAVERAQLAELGIELSAELLEED